MMRIRGEPCKKEKRIVNELKKVGDGVGEERRERGGEYEEKPGDERMVENKGGGKRGSRKNI